MINNKTIRQVVINSKLFPCGGTTYNEVTGPICNFKTDLAAPLKSCICDFVPIQSGTPTPSSPLLITGHTGLNVYKTGANIWNGTVEHGSIDNTTGEETSSPSLWRSVDYIIVKPNTSYYFKTEKGLLVYWYDVNGDFISYLDNVGTINKTVTSPSNAFKCRLRLFSNYSDYEVGDVSMNYPSTDTAYHAYVTATTYPVSWTSHGTIYGGSLDVTNGVLATTWKKGSISAEDIINVSSSGGNYIVNIGGPDDISLNGKIMSTDYSYNTGNVDNTIKVVNGKIRINDNRCIDVETASSLLDGLEIYYEVDDPTTTTLTAEDINTIEGINNIWNDAGTTTIKYPVSGGSCNGIMKFLPIFYPCGKGVNRNGSTF